MIVNAFTDMNPLSKHPLLNGAPYDVINNPTAVKLREFFEKKIWTAKMFGWVGGFIFAVQIARAAMKYPNITIGGSLDLLLMGAIGVYGVYLYSTTRAKFDVSDSTIEEHAAWTRSKEQQPAAE